MKIIQSILTKNPCYTAGKKIAVKGLMLHSVGCSQPSAQVFVKRWNSASHNSACVHAFIDGNTGDVYQCLPWNHRGWHSGGSANNTHIGVEMCEPACIKYISGSTFTCSDVATAKAVVQRTYDTAVQLFAHLCKQYNLDPLADGVIVSHREGYKRRIASNHGDPEHLWNQLGMGYTMDTFRKAVKAAIGETSVETVGVKKLTVDGLWGKSTTKRLQEIFGTPIDGKVSNQWLKYKAINPGLRSGWDWKSKPNGKGSQLIKAMQKWAGMPVTEQDGVFGQKTASALQKKLGTPVDGVISKPSQMVKFLQIWANEQL